MAVKYLGPCGGEGGGDRRMNVNEATRIQKIQIRHGHAIDAIRVIYEDNGSTTSTDWWGGVGGQFSEFNLDPDEFLRGIQGHYLGFKGQTVVRSITFVSNKRTYGPFGAETGVSFQLDANAGKVVGLAARSGELLDAIAIFVM